MLPKVCVALWEFGARVARCFDFSREARKLNFYGNLLIYKYWKQKRIYVIFLVVECLGQTISQKEHSRGPCGLHALGVSLQWSSQISCWQWNKWKHCRIIGMTLSSVRLGRQVRPWGLRIWEEGAFKSHLDSDTFSVQVLFCFLSWKKSQSSPQGCNKGEKKPCVTGLEHLVQSFINCFYTGPCIRSLQPVQQEWWYCLHLKLSK